MENRNNSMGEKQLLECGLAMYYANTASFDLKEI